MNKNKHALAHLLVTFLGLLTGFFIALSLFVWYGGMYEGWDRWMIPLLLIGLLALFSKYFLWTIVGIVITLISCVLFGELFYRRRRNKFRRFIGSTFGSFVSVSIFLAIVLTDMSTDEIEPAIFGLLIAVFLISIVLIILPEIPDRFARRS